MKILKRGDTVIFDSVSRMSRNAEEGFQLYMELLEKGINLEFINEPHINTDYYKKMQAQTVAIAKSGRESVEMKNRIIKMSKCFSGNMSDKECMEILQIARNTFYKYKRELLAETEDAGSTVE